MKVFVLTVLLGASALSVWAQGPPQGGKGGGGGTEVELRIPNESAPPGGLVQMKLMLTQPTPITTGHVRNSHSNYSVSGIEIFNTIGVASGAAVLNGHDIQVQYSTTVNMDPNSADYPIMIVSLAIPKNAKLGDSATFTLDPSSNFLLALLGVASVKPIPPAIITVGGSVSITNVIPGGGVLPAGAVIRVLGTGFSPSTRLVTEDLASSVTVVSNNEIRFTLATATQLSGKRIQVINPDGSQDIYFSYMRAVPVGHSVRPLLGKTIPIFSTQAYTQAVYNAFLAQTTNTFSALAVQNPNLAKTPVTIDMYATDGTLLGGSTITLAPRARIVREISELTQGVAPVPGSYVVVTSAAPVQSLGLQCDVAAISAVPVSPSATQP